MDVPILIAAKIFGMGMPELIIILAVALLIFGPKNLPKLGATLGKTVKSVREGMDGKELDDGEVIEADDDVDDDDDDEDDEYEEVVVRRKKKSNKS